MAAAVSQRLTGPELPLAMNSRYRIEQLPNYAKYLVCFHFHYPARQALKYTMVIVGCIQQHAYLGCLSSSLLTRGGARIYTHTGGKNRHSIDALMTPNQWLYLF